MKKTVGIIGGMGPMATADLFIKIINNTKADSDQEHIHVVIDNNTSIPDRTTYILSGGANPAKEIFNSAKKLISSGAEILIMPCNTAHYFYNEVMNYLEELMGQKSVKFINMIEETARYIRGLDKSEKVYLLATKGTYKSKIYTDTLASFGIEVIEPSDKLKQRAMDMIYDYKNGDFEYVNEDLEVFKTDATSKGAKNIILGCTELPLIFEKLKYDGDTIDPTNVLALSAIEEAIRFDKPQMTT